jgi:hypothetical protein
MTVKVYFNDGHIEEFPNAYAYWEWGDDEERNDSGFRINSIDRNFNSAVAFVYPSECTKIETNFEECDRVFKRAPSEGLISGKLYRIFAEISRECKRQNEKWGEQNHQMLYPEYLEQARESAENAKRICALNASIKKLSWYDILMEKFLEAFAETEPEKQREEMIQVAAVAVQIIKCLNRKKEAKRGNNGLQG